MNKNILNQRLGNASIKYECRILSLLANIMKITRDLNPGWGNSWDVIGIWVKINCLVHTLDGRFLK